MATGILLSKETVDYKKKDGTPVSGFTVSLGLKPRKKEDNFEGFKVHANIWVSEDKDQKLCEQLQVLNAGDCIEAYLDTDRYGNKAIEEIELIQSGFFDINSI